MARIPPRNSDRVFVAVFASVAAMASGCGGPQFDRTPGVAKYPALPGKSKVLLAEAVDDVPQPAVVVGVMRLPSSANALSQEEAEKRFLSYAPRFGCDAVVDVDAHASQVEKRKKERVLKDGGKVEIKTSKSTEVHTQWTAQCVRTAKAGTAPPAKKSSSGKTTAKATPATASPATAPKAATAKPAAKAKTVDMTDVRSDEQIQRLQARADALRKAQQAAEKAAAEARAAAQAAKRAAEAHEAELARSSGKSPKRRKTTKRAPARAKPATAKKQTGKPAAPAETEEERRERARQEAIAKLKADQEAAHAKNSAAQKAKAAAAARKEAEQRRRDERAEEARKKKEAAAARRAEAKRKKQEAAQARKKAAEDKRRQREEAKKKAAEEKARKIAEAKRKAEEEKARKEAAEKARLAGIVKRFDDAISAAQVAGLAEAIADHPEHEKVKAANDALQKAALARVDQWLVAVAPAKTKKGVKHGWKATNPTKAPVVVFFEVAGKRQSAFLQPGKGAKGSVLMPAEANGTTRLLGAFVVTRELGIDKKSVLPNAPLDAIAKVWTEAPDTPLTPVFLARITSTLAEQASNTASIRGSIRAKRRPGPDEYQPAKVSLKNTAKRDVTVIYDAGTGRFERLLLKARGKMSLTLMIPPEHKAALNVMAVLPRLRSLAWLTGDWSLGSARLVVLPAAKGQVAAFVISSSDPQVIPLATTSDGKNVVARGKVPDAFARTVFFDLSGCESGCDATLTIPVGWQDKYKPKGGRTLRFKAAISGRKGTAKFVADH